MSTLIPVNEIYMSHEFNCRGWFIEADCADLAASIKDIGLQQPITVRELRAVAVKDSPSEQQLIDKGFKYHLIAGHRRFTACKMVGMLEIPAEIKPWTMTDDESHDLNAIENIQRKQLNMQQEAHAIRHLVKKGLTATEIGRRLGVGTAWATVRYMLYALPEEIQVMAGKDLLTGKDIRHLYKERGATQFNLLRMAAELRDARISHKEREPERLLKTKKPQSKTLKRQRNVSEIRQLIDQIQDAMSKFDRDAVISGEDWISLQGNSVITKVLAWATGEISNQELWASIVSLGKLHNYLVIEPTYLEDVIA